MMLSKRKNFMLLKQVANICEKAKATLKEAFSVSKNNLAVRFFWGAVLQGYHFLFIDHPKFTMQHICQQLWNY